MRLLQPLVIATLAALALMPLPALADAKALTTLNVRSGPGTGYPVIDVLRRGDWVNVATCHPGWCFIQTRHAEGWASAGYLAGLVDRDRRVVVKGHHRGDRVARWPEPWNEAIYPPRRLPVPYKHGVGYPERFW